MMVSWPVRRAEVVVRNRSRKTCPRNPRGTAFANLAAWSVAWGTLGARYSLSNCSGVSEMLVVEWVRWGLLLMVSGE